jgi:D-lactate dehydrogenase (cytochrome)
VLEDAAHFPGGHAAGVARPATEAEVAALLANARTVLPIGAQSSLTGGATPMGEVVLRCDRLATVEITARDRVRAGAGVPLTVLQDALARANLYYPPSPTFAGACVGGTIATNAAGAATFKYGSTRDWVQAITVVLASGEVLDVQRGDVSASSEGHFEIVGADRTIRVDIPTYAMPDVPKRSAGYHAAPGMDLVDLFIGAEGTLGILVSAELRVVPDPPAACLLLVPVASEREAIQIAGALRDESLATWHDADARGIDVAAIEYLDQRSIALLREDDSPARTGVRLPAWAGVLLIVQLDLPAGTTAEHAYEQVAGALTAGGEDGGLARTCRLLHAHGVLEQTELAAPGDRRRAAQIAALREAVPALVNQRVGQAKRDVDPAIEKTAADMIVPFARFGDMMRLYRDAFGRRGLDYAVWGHVSDGNVHPNVIPRSLDDVRLGKEAILELGREVARLGGCPLAEHGVGRNAVKQQLLRELYGDRGLDEMRRVKRALDPGWKLAPGVLFQKASI